MNMLPPATRHTFADMLIFFRGGTQKVTVGSNGGRPGCDDATGGWRGFRSVSLVWCVNLLVLLYTYFICLATNSGQNKLYNNILKWKVVGRRVTDVLRLNDLLKCLTE